MRLGVHARGRFVRDKVCVLLACFGVDIQAASAAPVREGGRVYVCANGAEAEALNSFFVAFGIHAPDVVVPGEFPGVFHDGDGGFELFLPVPDHAGDFFGA